MTERSQTPEYQTLEEVCSFCKEHCSGDCRCWCHGHDFDVEQELAFEEDDGMPYTGWDEYFGD